MSVKAAIQLARMRPWSSTFYSGDTPFHLDVVQNNHHLLPRIGYTGNWRGRVQTVLDNKRGDFGSVRIYGELERFNHYIKN